MLELAAIKDENEIIYYIIYYNEKYDELFVIPKYNKKEKIKNIDEFINKTNLDLIKYSKYLKRETIIFPKDKIKVYYDPVACLNRILREPRDEIERVVKELVEIISEESGEDAYNFGIGGSILLGYHGVNSDIDLAYYGKEARKVYSAIGKLREENILEPLREEQIRMLFRERELDKIFSFDIFEKIEKRKLIEGIFKNKIYSIKFIIRKNLEPVKIFGNIIRKIRIIDDSLSFVFPSIYLAKGIEDDKEYEIVSYKLRYTEMLKKGEKAIVRGLLEEDKYGKLRLVIQSKEDYIQPIELV